MSCRRIFAVFLITILTISPVWASYCITECTHAEMNVSMVMESTQEMAGMADCHDHSIPQPSKKDGYCSMAGCHVISSACFHADTHQFLKPDNSEPFRFISIAISADTPPPVKPPA
jgi:hypothetical protein